MFEAPSWGVRNICSLAHTSQIVDYSYHAQGGLQHLKISFNNDSVLKEE